MSEFKGTKGIWSVNLKPNIYEVGEMYEVNFGTDGEVIAEGVYTLNDARLIAASLELLEALKSAIIELEKYVPITEVSVLTQAQQAINKALNG